MSLISTYRSVMKLYHHYSLGNKSHCPSKTIIYSKAIYHPPCVSQTIATALEKPASDTSSAVFQICHVLLSLIHSLFAVTANVEGASLFEPSFFLFTTKTIGLSTRMEKSLKVCVENTIPSRSVNNNNIIPKASCFFFFSWLAPTSFSPLLFSLHDQ